MLTKEDKKYKKAEQRRGVNISRKWKRVCHEYESRTDECPENDFDSLASGVSIDQSYFRIIDQAFHKYTPNMFECPSEDQRNQHWRTGKSFRTTHPDASSDDPIQDGPETS